MVTSLISMSSHCEPKVAYNRQPDLDESLNVNVVEPKMLFCLICVLGLVVALSLRKNRSL